MGEARMDILSTIEIDIDEILEDLRLQWLDHKEYNYNPTALSKEKVSGDNLMMCCPFHSENSASFGILRSHPYTWQCFSCDTSGNLFQLVRHVLNLPTVAHAEYYFTKNYVDLAPSKRNVVDIASIMDKGGNDKKVAKTLETDIAQYIGKRDSYMYGRGFNDRTLTSYEVGFDSSKKTMLIPVRTSEGTLRFVKARHTERKQFLNEENIYKKDIIYGLYYLIRAMGRVREIYLTESETDTMACYQAGLPAGSIMGRILFKEQVDELRKAGIEVLNLFYDNDLRGQEAVEKSYNLLKGTPIKINVVKYPVHYGIDTVDEEEIPYKDANDLLKMKMFKSIKVISYETLKMLKIRR